MMSRICELNANLNRRWLRHSACLPLLATIMLGACLPAQQTVTQKPLAVTDTADSSQTSTPTPDSCTGWDCQVGGVVYSGTNSPGFALTDLTVTLIQTSYCSPTRGSQQTQTDASGSFVFDRVFFHDTDHIQIQIDLEGTGMIVWDSIGEYCFYCSCFEQPLEIWMPSTLEPR